MRVLFEKHFKRVHMRDASQADARIVRDTEH
jgi:hypothetical protein